MKGSWSIFGSVQNNVGSGSTTLVKSVPLYLRYASHFHCRALPLGSARSGPCDKQAESRNQAFSYFSCLLMEEYGSISGSVQSNDGSGSKTLVKSVPVPLYLRYASHFHCRVLPLGSERPGPFDQQADTRPPVTRLQQVKKRPQEGQEQKEGKHLVTINIKI